MTFSNPSNLIKCLGVAGVMAFSVGASADHSYGDLDAWAASASDAVDGAMFYPTGRMLGSGRGTASFRVTIDRDGDVIKAVQTKRLGVGPLNLAAKKVLRRADFPALPADYDGQKLTFVVDLTYGVSPDSWLNKKALRQGRVSSRQIAASSGITILDANAD